MQLPNSLEVTHPYAEQSEKKIKPEGNATPVTDHPAKADEYRIMVPSVSTIGIELPLQGTVDHIHDKRATRAWTTLTWIRQGSNKAGRLLYQLLLLVWIIVCAILQVPPVPKAVIVPFCEFKIISHTALCTNIPHSIKEPKRAQWADFPTLVSVQNGITDTFAGDDPTGSEMALQITRAELATSDLIVAVRYSSLKTAGRLADALGDFVRDASDAGESLQELDAKALGAMDSIININDWALQAIDRASSQTPGLLSSLAIWRVQEPAADVVTEMFNEAMTSQSRILSGLVIQAKHSHGQLKRLKERLQAIRDLVTKENILLSTEHGELLASIWTMLGGNRADLRSFETNLQLLGNLEKYTDDAKKHISQALLNMKMMQAQMKDLREKVSQPDILGTKIPVNVHIRTIAEGIRRMKERRIRALEKDIDIRTLMPSE